MKSTLIQSAKERFREEYFFHEENNSIYHRGFHNSAEMIDIEEVIEQEITLALSEYEKNLRQKVEQLMYGNSNGVATDSVIDEMDRNAYQKVLNLLSESAEQG